MKWWGASWAAQGWACLMYDWIYTPLLKLWGVEPWSLTAYALTLIGIGVAVNILQMAIGERPVASHP